MLRRVINQLRALLAHWGTWGYVTFAALWLTLSIPLYLNGWGLFSILSLPLLLLIISLITCCVIWITKPTDTEFNSTSDVNLRCEDIEVTVYDGPYLNQGKPTEDAIKYYTSIIKNVDSLKTFVSGELLAGYNENWLNEEIGQINEHQFKDLVSLKSVVLFDEIGFAIAYFDDGNLFGEHSIEVSIENGIPRTANIVG